MTATIVAPSASSDSGQTIVALLQGVLVTGAGVAFAPGAPARYHSLQVFGAGTAVATGCVVNLEGSLDGTHWAKIGAWTLGTQAYNDIVNVGPLGVIYVRANLVTLTGGTAPSVTAYYFGAV